MEKLQYKKTGQSQPRLKKRAKEKISVSRLPVSAQTSNCTDACLQIPNVEWDVKLWEEDQSTNSICQKQFFKVV